MQQLYDKASRIRLAIFDVDGVLTDGSLYLADSGEEMKAFNSRDGHGMKMLSECGIELAIITGRTSRCVELRAMSLGIKLLYQGISDKARAYSELLAARKLDPSATAYMGDDVVDLPVMCRCGLALTVPDAPLMVKQHAHYVTRAQGGHGAAREACELIMSAQGVLEGKIQSYLR